jgi:serine protease inhibitor
MSSRRSPPTPPWRLLLATTLFMATTLATSASVSAALPNAPMAAVAQGNTAFAIDLYQQERSKPGNLFFSPYSISTALAMTYAGARGDTAAEMAKVLHFTAGPTELPTLWSQLSRRMDEVGRSNQVALRIANSLWCQRTFTFNENFLTLNRDFFQATARQVDFVGNTEGTREEINFWVAASTNDKIRELLQRGQLSRDTLLVLCNAVYFKGAWLEPFDPRSTRPAPFFLRPTEPIQVPMMTRSMTLRSKADAELNLFSLPYAGKDISMIILLPRELDGLASMEKQLTAPRLRELLDGLDRAAETKTVVNLPKFKLDCRLPLTRELAAMGMPSAFQPRADFSGISSSRGLFISDVVHQAFVDVSEEGTEAAAATAVVIAKSAVMKPPPPLKVDHPFLFLIRENQTGSVLFMGRVLDPRK